MTNERTTTIRKPDSAWVLALAQSIETEVRECYECGRKPGDEHTIAMTHQGLTDLVNALLYASIQSEISPSAVDHLIWQVEHGESFDRSVMLNALRALQSRKEDKSYHGKAQAEHL